MLYYMREAIDAGTILFWIENDKEERIYTVKKAGFQSKADWKICDMQKREKALIQIKMLPLFSSRYEITLAETAAVYELRRRRPAAAGMYRVRPLNWKIKKRNLYHLKLQRDDCKDS